MVQKMLNDLKPDRLMFLIALLLVTKHASITTTKCSNKITEQDLVVWQ